MCYQLCHESLVASTSSKYNLVQVYFGNEGNKVMVNDYEHVYQSIVGDC